MDIKERLERLDSTLSGRRQTREEIISDLRKRLERLTDPRQAKLRGKSPSPIDEWIEGEEIHTPYGKAFVSQEDHGSGYRHGGILLDRVMEIPTYPVSLVCSDDSLLDLDFSNTLFIDVETTGLSGGTGTYAFLVGLGYFDGSRFVTRQFFLRDFSEERGMLWALGDLAKRFRFLVTFNGKRFDIPVLETRYILTQMESPFRDMPNYDLLYPARRIWRGSYEDCRLTTLESKALDIHRHDDIPSEMIPSLYFDYLSGGDARRIHRVFYHNRVDILSLVTLVTRIHELVYLPQRASGRGWTEAYALGRLFSQRRRTGEAIECFQAALRRCRESGEWEIMRSLSLALKKDKQMDQAVSVWMEMISFDRVREVFPYEEAAKFFEHQKRDYTEALRWVKEAVQRVATVKPDQRRALEHRYRRLLSKMEREKGR